MARGQATKDKITQVIMTCFPGAFVNGKELRIAALEDGTEVQIKITLTAAKENVEHSNELHTPAAESGVFSLAGPMFTEPTEEEIENIKKAVEALGL